MPIAGIDRVQARAPAQMAPNAPGRDEATLMAGCRECGAEFHSWDEAVNHVENAHGQDRAPEDARALIHRY